MGKRKVVSLELQAMAEIEGHLAALSTGEAARVLTWACRRYCPELGIVPEVPRPALAGQVAFRELAQRGVPAGALPPGGGSWHPCAKGPPPDPAPGKDGEELAACG